MTRGDSGWGWGRRRLGPVPPWLGLRLGLEGGPGLEDEQ